MQENIAVKLSDISKQYNNEMILKNFSMKFIKNKITVLLGPSGCGKTTLLNIISGIDKNYSGEVLLNVKEVSYIFQEYRLIPWLTVYENVDFVLKSYMEKDERNKVIIKYLKLVNLYEHKNKYPGELSGGMQRRVAIARAFAYKSELLLMDEPFVGLDKDLKQKIIKEFLQLWKYDKRTIILVTHDMDEANSMGDDIIDFKTL
ncbi:ABC transporter ATP-binding protein [Hathewaya limosa]|uniref:NitT/TauT family transport system ATP-binding protein n=1 Tax=Hathewaya limosa TaxID=1536 RepID=A0ABU0JQG1_HATLI|nr:ABC transporter ATP-binding protein [Hathewaya limosa]AWZ48022.1 ABC transporter [Clostridiaceae bacterium 14S0207]MDQ0479332.1 NitT/TauT family transport system ATP-binding protein [Hathewaya limosa]